MVRWMLALILCLGPLSVVAEDSARSKNPVAAQRSGGGKKFALRSTYPLPCRLALVRADHFVVYPQVASPLNRLINWVRGTPHKASPAQMRMLRARAYRTFTFDHFVALVADVYSLNISPDDAVDALTPSLFLEPVSEDVDKEVTSRDRAFLFIDRFIDLLEEYRIGHGTVEISMSEFRRIVAKSLVSLLDDVVEHTPLRQLQRAFALDAHQELWAALAAGILNFELKSGWLNHPQTMLAIYHHVSNYLKPRTVGKFKHEYISWYYTYVLEPHLKGAKDFFDLKRIAAIVQSQIPLTHEETKTGHATVAEILLDSAVQELRKNSYIEQIRITDNELRDFLEGRLSVVPTPLQRQIPDAEVPTFDDDLDWVSRYISTIDTTDELVDVLMTLILLNRPKGEITNWLYHVHQSPLSDQMMISHETLIYLVERFSSPENPYNLKQFDVAYGAAWEHSRDEIRFAITEGVLEAFIDPEDDWW